MMTSPHIIRLIQSHTGLESNNYTIAVEWAINLIRNGIENDNLLMLASFHDPIDSVEIRPYVSAVLNDFGIEELKGEAAIRGKIYYHLVEILSNKAIRKNLHALYELSLRSDYELDLLNFYLLYHAWDELENGCLNFYIDGVDLNNIEDVLKDEVEKWIERFEKQ